MSTNAVWQFSWTLTRQTRQPVLRHCSCGSGWSVPCVSIQLTLSQCGWSVPCVSIQLTLSQCGWSVPCVSIQLTLSQCFTCVSIQLTLSVSRPLRGSVSCGSGWSVPCVSIQLTLSQFSMFHRMELASSCPSRAWRSASRPWARALPKQWACTRGCAPTSTHPRLATTQSSSRSASISSGLCRCATSSSRGAPHGGQFATFPGSYSAPGVHASAVGAQSLPSTCTT